ncbi:MAG: insulinase family protein [Clostridiales bacterium]|nr:insulinase family protein [Clostridiales bacterium]
MPNQYTLSNGITVITERLAHSPSVTVGIWVRAGSVDEEKNAGVSHFIEHMLFKGTNTRGWRQISEDIEKLGGQINAFTGKEATCYYVKTLSEHLPDCLAVLADMLTDSVFDEAEMEKEKGVILEEIKMIEDVPDDWGHDLITEAIFRGGSLERRIIGTRESVLGISRRDALDYLAARYTPDGIVVSVCGLFEEDALRAVLEKFLGGLRGRQAPRVFRPDLGVPDRDSLVRDIEQTHLFFGTKGVRYEDDDLYVFDLYASLLGGGMSSRLFTAVREEKGLAYAVYAAQSSFTDDGQFEIYAGVADEKAEAAAAAIREEVARLAEDSVSEEELARVREQYKSATIFRRESGSSRMFSNGRNLLLTGRYFSEEEILAGADAVGPADIRRIAERLADFSAYAGVVIGPRAVNPAGLLGQ